MSAREVAPLTKSRKVQVNAAATPGGSGDGQKVDDGDNEIENKIELRGTNKQDAVEWREYRSRADFESRWGRI